LRLSVPPRLSISCFALRCKLLKSMEPPGSRGVLGHYDKSPVLDCGLNLSTRSAMAIVRGAADVEFATPRSS
jgi:hypothetical protein